METPAFATPSLTASEAKRIDVRRIDRNVAEHASAGRRVDLGVAAIRDPRDGTARRCRRSERDGLIPCRGDGVHDRADGAVVAIDVDPLQAIRNGPDGNAAARADG